MPIIDRIADYHIEMTERRHRIHAHPETAFEEHKTAELISQLLEAFGISDDRALLEHALSVRSKDRYRAAAPWRCAPTWMHCTLRSETILRMSRNTAAAMPLGAAKHLAETRNFAETIYFIFHPAEENESGARLMIEEGALGKYPVEAVYGMQNWPELGFGPIRHPARADDGRFRAIRRIPDGLPHLRRGNGDALRAALSANRQCRARNRDRRNHRGIARRRERCQARLAAEPDIRPGLPLEKTGEIFGAHLKPGCSPAGRQFMPAC